MGVGVKCQPRCHVYTLLPGNTENAGEWSHVGWGARWEGDQEGPEHKQNADDSLASEAKAVPSNKQPLLPGSSSLEQLQSPLCVSKRIPFCFQSAASLSSDPGRCW